MSEFIDVMVLRTFGHAKHLMGVPNRFCQISTQNRPSKIGLNVGQEIWALKNIRTPDKHTLK